MHVAVGDRLHVQGRVVGAHAHTAEVVEVHGENGEPPYLVRYDDGREALVFPGPDAWVEHPQS
ncbi:MULTISPECIES: DUF1918 domain-containing protein [Rhodococcus]|jgi:hypothetical protein|uniref:DUF1918 domain-containing protein n=1 Tax=Rhodococcus oxybenzonivorans TaxID=1990687 RepID=A0AAE4UUD1_9NOCA|nr:MULTISPECIES: DUF1918 domain-containing protein [Rhodococcus]MDV7244136.1 DUF1918 domain-containing protein [Rhodococcus oxybenzonivorans]MDV7263083.1 DUF1918 domain-containing protein [Rhodococcus oxybenzonivorans]MDV7274622.1 DUF1918 domain-containing protein [Rhodococcus oxybenzonivorans]MDV7335935.1 DUF1918 domain-containing protein [Rhodococcus oxybenzonivorans]MDV7345572.1 DUF1918 domain-containing protein [Rhodococcus oxybenzonivorans]